MALSLVIKTQCQSSFPQEHGQHLPTPCTTLEKIGAKSLCTASTQSSSPLSNNLNSSNQDSKASHHSACSKQSTRILWPRLPITYNEAALTQLHGRPQVRMFNCVSIHLPPSSDKSPTDSYLNDTEAVTNSTDYHRSWLPSPSRGGVTIEKQCRQQTPLTVWRRSKQQGR